MPALYRDRLRLEGLVLAAVGVAGSIGLLVGVDEASDGPASTIGQLVVVAVLLLTLGRRAVAGWLDRAEPVASVAEAGSGEPTPLLHVVGIAAILTVGVGVLAWDAGLRVTGGCALVGLAQALVFAPMVARHEREQGVVVVRLPGSRLGRGTRLGALPAGAVGDV